ncbi:hypothetical protein BGZ50_001675 [Haplosporangium sp. Z 11]|nr:hypothetical protein BGZ50_001675 [Haplosporangium sp. Z 11]
MDIPEIRLMVGQFLHPSDVVSCARVCKVWHDTFMPLLWSEIDCTSSGPWPRGNVIEKYVCYIRVLDMEDFTLNGYSRACTRLQRLNITDYRQFNTTWPRLAAFICQNPNLQSLEINFSATRGSFVIPSQFMAAWTASALKLKRLRISNVKLDTEAMNLLLDLTLRLSTLELEWVDIGELGSMDRWSSFPHLETLLLDVHSGLSAAKAICWTQKCPRLRVFEYTALRLLEQKALLPVDDIVDLFLRTCPLLENLKLWCHHLKDSDLARILKVCPRMTVLSVPETGFGPLAFESLVRHFSYLQELNIEQCRQVTGAMCQHVLASCPELRRFYADRLNVGDMIRAASRRETKQQQHFQQQEQQQQAGEEGGSNTILPQGWVCTKMEIMHVYLCGSKNGPQDWQCWAMEQISKLTRLEELCIDPPIAGQGHSKCGIQLRLENGLEMLSSLKRLEDVSVADQNMEQEDIYQILQMWPALSRLLGRLHFKIQKQDNLSATLGIKRVKTGPEHSLRQAYYYQDYEDSSEEDEDGHDDVE